VVAGVKRMFDWLVKQWNEGFRPVFWMSVGASLAFGSAVLANQPKEKQTLTAVAQQIAELQYPAMPKELVDRINGTSQAAKVSSLMKIDPNLTQEWGLTSIGFFDAFPQMTAPLKAQAGHCAKEVVVAVIDTGVDYTHPELRDGLWVNHGETGPWQPTKEMADKGYAFNCRDKSCNGIDDDKNGYVDDVVGWDFVHDVPLPFDTHGHGTHIAGIISGSAGMGAQGVCPSVSLMALKYYDNGGAGYNNLSNTVRAIEYAVANGAQIINYSGGGADPAASERAAVAEAQRKGVLFVAAAGNDGRNNDRRPYYPASYPIDNLIGVASVNKYERLLPSSNFGKSVHVAAPGLMILSTLPGGKFGTMSGTSQATAFVTGAAALVAAQMGASNFDYRKVKAWVLDGARPMKLNGSKQLLAAGLLSLPGSLQAQRAYIAKTAPKQTAEVAVSARPTTTKTR
jgi:thermitase